MAVEGWVERERCDGWVRAASSRWAVRRSYSGLGDAKMPSLWEIYIPKSTGTFSVEKVQKPRGRGQEARRFVEDFEAGIWTMSPGPLLGLRRDFPRPYAPLEAVTRDESNESRCVDDAGGMRVPVRVQAKFRLAGTLGAKH